MNEWLEERLELELHADPSSIAVVTTDGTIAWTYRAWDRFASANGGAPERCGVGASYFDAVLGTPHDPFLEMLRRCRRVRSATEVDYECSSDRTQRMFRLRVFALEERGFLLVHHLRVESDHPAVPAPPTVDHVSRGLVVMCSGCRRTARADYSRWDWIPSWISHPPARVSHGLCPTCAELMFFRDDALR